MVEVTDRQLCFHMAATMALMVVGGTLAALSPLALKHLVDAATLGVDDGAATAGAILVPSAIYIAVLSGGRLVSDIRPVLANEVEQRLTAALRRRFFRHVLSLPLSTLLHRRGGELLHSLELGRGGVQLTVNHLLTSFVPTIFELSVMALILARLQQPDLMLVFGVTAALYIVVFATGSVRLIPHAHLVTDASLTVHGQLADGISNVETLRCFGAEGVVEESLEGSSGALTRRWRSYYRANAGTTLAATIVFGASLAACLTVTAHGVARGSLSVGDLVLSSVYLLQMIRPLEVLGSAARDISRALGCVPPLLDVLDEPSEPPPRLLASGKSETPRRAPSIRFEGITFGYEPDRPIIRDLNLEIAAGRTTAIVGPSGSGKSSLIRMLLRLYSPQAGRILLDGVPIDSLPLTDLRARMAFVPQDTVLLHASIASNISLGIPGASQEDIVRAAGAAQLQQLIERLPDRYDTLVGERGLKLSGGERQRLAIARAALRARMVFLLDEPTSMLDSETESNVMQAVRQIKAGSTTLIVAHRLSTVMDADEIVVLDQGVVRERGNHRSLIEHGGLYAQMWRRQVDGHAAAPDEILRRPASRDPTAAPVR